MGTNPALVAYEAFAAAYNDFNHANDYERWLGGSLLPELRKHGLPEGGTALDVGCGTGRAFRPLLRRGWRVQGCDLSPAMLELAAQESDGSVALHAADMRELPHLGDFDLVLSLNDSVNYLLGDGDLVLALSRMKANMTESGLLIFDVNTSSMFARSYSEVREVEHQGSRWIWTGRGEVAPSVFEAEIEGDRLPEPVRQLERFRSLGEVQEAMRSAGIRVLAACGMTEAGEEILLSKPPDESSDYKLIFIGAGDNDRSGTGRPPRSPSAELDRPPFIWGS
jgi:SAM-dependent methyltransferase